MAGLKITIPASVTDTSLPLRKDDPILSAGSLLLLQPSHDVTPWVSGIPSDGYEAPNLAELQARQLITTGSLKPVFDFQGSLSGSDGLYERTLKGGFHTIITQSSDIGAGNGLSIGLPDSIMQYILDHPTHNFYYSIWGNITRNALTTDPDGAKTLMGIKGNSSGEWVALQSHTTSQLYPSSLDRVGAYSTGRNTEGNGLFSVAGKPSDNVQGLTLSNFPSANNRAVAQFGTVPTQNNFASIRAALQSWVLYRVYIEDLTISGRSFTDVSLIDQDLFEKEVLTDGGKYFGDSFTDPSTIP